MKGFVLFHGSGGNLLWQQAVSYSENTVLIILSSFSPGPSPVVLPPLKVDLPTTNKLIKRLER